MKRRWVRRGAIAAGLSVAVHLLLLAGVPLGQPGTRADLRPRASEVALVPVPVPVSETMPRPAPAPQPAQEVRPLAAPYQDRLAPLPWDAVRDGPPPTREPPLEPAVEVVPPPAVEPTGPTPAPELPSPREAARRLAVFDDANGPGREERLGAHVDALLRESLPPRVNDRSPMPELRPDGEGNLIHEDGALYAKIAPDGSVTFSQRYKLSVDEFARGGKSPDPVVQEIRDLHTTIPGVPLTVFKAPAGGDDSAGLGLTIRPSLDLNDLILRAKGDDPLAARKRRFLRLTEELRDQLAARYEKVNQRRAKLHASRNLERLWADGDLAFATKRRLLFELWEECEEAGADTGGEGGGGEPPATVDAGQDARDHIIAFIRQRLPPGSPEAYSPAELGRLNAGRASRQPFAPY